MDTIRDHTDGSKGATTDSQSHKDAYSNDAFNSSRLPMNNDSAQSNKLEQKGLLPTVTLSDTAVEIPVEARRQINTLANASNGGIGYSEQVNQGLRGIIDRHGVDGFNRMIGVLDELSNSNFATYRHHLRNNSSEQAEQPHITNALRNLERLADPEVARQVIDLNRTMRQEGYTQRLSIDDLTEGNINILSTQPEQRRAFIEFNNEARFSMGPGFFLQENPDMLDALPTEQLRLYRLWSEQRSHR